MIILQSNDYNIKFAKPTFKKSNALFLCLVSSLIGPSSLPFDDNTDELMMKAEGIEEAE